MSMNQQLLDYVKDFKQRNPRFVNKDDERVARFLSRKDMLPEGVEYKPVEQPQVEVEKKNSSLSFMGDLLDYTIDENSSDFWKESYNRSLSSEVGKALFGKEKYDTSKYAEDMNVLEDIGTTVVSFMFPADILAMKVGGKAGVMAYQGLAGKAAPHLAKTGGILSERILLGAAGQAGGLAAYEGAFGGISAYNEGKSREEILDATTEGIVHGGVLGALTGAVGQGMAQKQAELLKKGLWNKSKKAKDGVGKALSKGEERFINLTLGVPGQIGAESAIFTGSELIDRVQAGEDIDSREALVSFAKNVGLFGVLKAKSRLWSDTKKVIAEPIDKFDKAMGERILRSKENVEKDLQEQNIDAKLDAPIEVINKERLKSKELLDKADKDLKELQAENNFVEKTLKEIDPKMDANTVARLINTASANTGKLMETSREINSKIETLPEGNQKNSLIEKKAQIDGYIKEWTKLSEQYNVQVGKEKSLYTEESILERNKELGLDFSKLDLKTEQGRQEASDRINREIDINVQRERDKITPQGKEEAALDVKTTEEFFKTKDVVRYPDNAKQQKEYSKRVEEFSKEDKKVVESTGNFEIDTPEFTRYQQNKNIVRHFIQNVYPTKIGGTVKAGAFVKGGLQRAREIDSFAKWLAKEGKTFSKMENVDFQNYLSQKPNHLTALQNLREFVITNQIVESRKFNLTQTQAKDFAKKFIGESPQGISLDNKAHKVTKNSLSFIQPKTNQPIVKYISNKLSGLIKKVRKDANPNATTTWSDIKGKALDNKAVNTLVDMVFGDKGTKDKARLFRKSMVSWASNKYGIKSAEKELIKQEVLGDKANKDVIDKSYDVSEYKKAKEKLVKEYIEEISKGGESIESEGFYNTKEIADGLKKLSTLRSKKGNISIEWIETTKKGDQKQYQRIVDKNTSEGLLRYLIETSPRLNEIVPEGRTSTVVKEVETKFQLQKDVKLDTASIKELEAQRKYFSEIPAYKNIQINLQKNLGKFRGEQVLGRIRGHVIDIAQGKAKIDTIPHEISHHAVDILTAVGTKKSKALIKDGKKMFGSEEKLVQAIGEYTAGRMKNRSMLSRAKQFVSRMMSEVRNFFGVQTKGDVVRMLSEKVLKGKLDTRTPQQILKADAVKFQTGKESKKVKEEFNERIHEFEKILMEEGMTRTELNKMREDYISSSYNDKGKGYRSYKLEKVEIGELERYRDYLSTRLEGAPGMGRDIREANMEYQITPSQQKKILEAMGVREGNIENIKSHNTFKQYLAFVRKYGTKTNPEDTSYLNISKFGEGLKLPWGVKRGIMPVYYVLDTYGGKPGKKLAQKIIDFDFIHNYKIKGQGDHHAHNIHTHLKKGKHQENFWLLDGEMRKKVMSERELTAKEKDFVKQMDIRDSDVYIAKEHYRNLTDYLWTGLMSAAKKHHNPVEFLQFKNRMGNKYVRDYMTRRVNPEALEIIKDGNFIEEFSKKLIQKAIAKEATRGKLTRMEIEQNKDRSLDKIKDSVHSDILNIFEHKHHRIKNGYLMERVPVLPEYIEGTGADGKLKRVKTYQTSAEAIVDPYVSGMSKYIATVEVFPEYTNIGGKYTLGGESKRADLEIKSKDAEFAEYAKKGIRRIIGLEQPDLFMSKLGRAGQSFASTSAVVGLSSPLSGVKNLLLGQIRNVASYGLMNTAKGIRLAFTPEGKRDARLKGALEYGAKTLELSDQKAFGLFRMDKAFKLNLMTQTENINRISAMEAGRLQFVEQMNYLQGKPGILGTKMKEGQTRDMMKDMWRLNNEQIDFLKKGEFNKPENRKKLEGIMEVVEHFSHVSSQGGTGVGNLPLWMSNQMTKPFLLFQRFATAVTWDSYRNYIVPAIKHGNFAPMIGVTFGSYVGGATLYEIYEYFFNTQPPKAGSPFLEKAMMNLHRAEFLGVFNELISPYEQHGALPNPIMEPVIVRNGIEAMTNIYAATPKFEVLGLKVGGGQTKTLEQALKDFTRKTVVVAAQAEKFYDARVHPDYSNQKRLNTMSREFKKQRNISQADVTTGTTRSPYYRRLKERIYFGTDEQIARSYWAAHNYLVKEIQYNNPTLRKAEVIKRAHSAINSSLQAMNPVNFSKEVKGRKFGVSQRRFFLNWIKENHGVRDYEVAIDLEKKYKKNLRKAKRFGQMAKYRRQYSVGNSF